ncbi:MAG: serine/threonine protein kinase [Planctomycetota bacterium]|nr:MAG: serine/threonine protein kinase [Planctomycetota bacterium]
MNQYDRKFAQAAIERGYLSPEDWKLYQENWESKKSFAQSLPDLLLIERRLSPQQVEEIQRSLLSPELPKQIGEYTILSQIGQGGMGVVYKAKNANGEIVALKVIYKNPQHTYESDKRFIREIQSIRSLNHPNIVKALDFGIDTKYQYYFLAMEYVEGESLAQWLKREGRIPVIKSLEIAQSISLALDYAYKKNIIHRDIKPENILFSRQGAVKILDFGLAKKLDEKNITRSGEMLGTPYYVAPEITQGEKDLTVAADIYSLGITLFQMISGKVPFDKPTCMQVIMQHMMDPLPQIQPLAPELPPSFVSPLQNLLEKMTSKNPKERISPAQLLVELEYLIDLYHQANTSHQENLSNPPLLPKNTLSPPSQDRPSTPNPVPFTSAKTQYPPEEELNNSSLTSPSSSLSPDESSCIFSYKKLQKDAEFFNQISTPQPKRPRRIRFFLALVALLILALAAAALFLRPFPLPLPLH